MRARAWEPEAWVGLSERVREPRSSTLNSFDALAVFGAFCVNGVSGS